MVLTVSLIEIEITSWKLFETTYWTVWYRWRNERQKWYKNRMLHFHV